MGSAVRVIYRMLRGAIVSPSTLTAPGSSEPLECRLAMLGQHNWQTPMSQPALDQLRSTAADLQQHRQQQAATDALRAGVLLHEYGDQSTYYFHHLHRQRQQATAIARLPL